MLNLQPEILNEAIALASVMHRGDKRWQRAFSRAARMLDGNPHAEMTERGLLVVSDTSGELYQANGECVRFDGPREVYCAGYFHNNHICKHRAAYQLVQIAERIRDKKKTERALELLDPAGRSFQADEHKKPTRYDRAGRVIEFETYTREGDTNALVKQTFLWSANRFCRI